ncbi:MAG: hypothetical protein WBH51_01980 [Mycolicibacter algericus]|uniref:hypothetical protein n=1 Tax=Mycolicibacter algericus TaxID=1288388 RepID=UPI003C757625
MSLLDSANEDVVVYPEEVTIDADGNTKTRPSKTGIPARARLQVQGQSGTSARRAEQHDTGFESEKVYTVRFPRSFTAEHGILGAQSQIEWNGQRWAVFGDANRYNGSRRTQHVEYVIRRS